MLVRDSVRERSSSKSAIDRSIYRSCIDIHISAIVSSVLSCAERAQSCLACLACLARATSRCRRSMRDGHARGITARTRRAPGSGSPVHRSSATPPAPWGQMSIPSRGALARRQRHVIAASQREETATKAAWQDPEQPMHSYLPVDDSRSDELGCSCTQVRIF